MASQMENPALAARGIPVVDIAAGKINSEYALDTLRKQYLAEVFDLTADTATMIAELAFGEGAR
jgi:hypothetical protein